MHILDLQNSQNLNDAQIGVSQVYGNQLPIMAVATVCSLGLLTLYSCFLIGCRALEKDRENVRIATFAEANRRWQKRGR